MSTEWLATYRLQLRSEFGFAEAAAAAEYLARLGISHLYLSPVVQAVAGSTHGYDVVDPTRISRDLGGEPAYMELCNVVERMGLGQLIDIVPNHMSIASADNPWWWDVLENGISSRYLPYFDLGWSWGFERIVLPVLGDRYGNELDAGTIRVEKGDSGFVVNYSGLFFPVSPRSYGRLIADAAAWIGNGELRFLGESFRDLPDYYGRDSADRKHALWSLFNRVYGEDEEAVYAIGSVMEQVNRDRERLHELLEEQNYRLAFWQTADESLSYRRFFDINTLIGVRIEDEQVLQERHQLVLGLVNRGHIDGLRIDHIDGLRDPKSYLDRLRARVPHNARLFVEKILAHGEALPRDWPVEGTTGYDFLNVVNGLFVDHGAATAMTHLYGELTGEHASFDEVVQEKKRLVLDDLFASDLADLGTLLRQISEDGIDSRDWRRRDLEEVLRELIVALPVYRTYVRPGSGEIDPSDAQIIRNAIEKAQARLPLVEEPIFEFLRRLLFQETGGELESEFIVRFQQLSSPVMAKGAEDTAFYCYNRLISLNEVGGHPGHFGASLSDFHASCSDIAGTWPNTMLATATHDTKRGEDARLRIDALSEMPEAWGEKVARWFESNQRHHAEGWPDRNTEYFIYQTLIGAWPLDLDRAVEFMVKAMREAKMFTNWRQPDETYEAAVLQFVEALLKDGAFCSEMETCVADIDRTARLSSLSQTLIKLTAPGVPDVYQGCELWDHSLVDPDNRRPVDYELRRRLLERAEQSDATTVMAEMASGLPKLWLLQRTLQVRKEHGGAFAGAYEPLYANGARSDHLVAFARGGEVITLAARLLRGIEDGWQDTTITLPPGEWRDVLTDAIHNGETPHPVGSVLALLPVALLVHSHGEYAEANE